ncbi:MAG TPA: glycoside hydrolase family 9 protein [Opitutus sp.]|nr:glycoside hydrolase family 9 protein [Opitutus sp.]
MSSIHHVRCCGRELLACAAAVVVLAGLQPLAAADASLSVSPTSVPASGSASPIRLNSIGFFPDAPKRATLACDQTDFAIVRVADGTVAFRGKSGPALHTAKTDTDETVRVADFSALSTPGRYVLEIDGVGRSAAFTIGSDVWATPFVAVMHGFYYWRCGTAVHGEWQGHTYAHAACHLDDGWLDEVGGGHAKHASVGGWHDAGDYNKYVVNAGVTVGLLLQAWEMFGDRLGGIALALPESGNATPDFLNEIRWELDWLLTMQLPDGRVYHKLSQRNFAYWGPPENDKADRYFAPWSTAATADFVAMTAAAARAYRPYDAAFADRCVAAAQLGWQCLAAHPENVAPDLHAFHTGAYAPGDATHRLWAAVELWKTTGDSACLHEFEHRAGAMKFDAGGPGWGDARDLAFGAYLLATKSGGRNPALVERLTTNLLETADIIVATDAANAYGRPLGGSAHTWFWGCNSVVAAQAYLLHVANRIHPSARYRDTALDALGFLFGRNFNARSYVTGLGFDPPEHPHDRRGGPAWPGYLVGGAWPTGRDWEDNWKNFRVNEIAINWNAALVFALAPFVDAASGAAAK